MKIRTNQTIYNCDFCNKRYLVKNAAYRHEDWCGSNPKNFPKCEGCKYLREIKKDVYCGDEDYGYHRECKAFFCDKKQIGLYPSKVLRNGYVERYPKTFEGEIVMPRECDYFEEGVNDSGHLPF